MAAGYDRRYLEFFELFNLEKFFEAHEVLEGLWRETQGTERDFYQGLIQIAAAFVHVQKKNFDGARKLFGTATKYLEKFPEIYEGLELKKLLEETRDSIFSKGPFPQTLFHPKRLS